MGAFADRLKSLRLKHNLSQQELADNLNISKSSVSMYERGQREPDFETLETIADFFNVDMNFIIGYSDDYPDWERIGNDQGIYPPNDYEGSYEDFVKYKVMQESDDLCDSYWDLYDNAIEYLKSLGCQIVEETTGNSIQVITPINEKLEVLISDLVSNFMVFGSSKPGIKKLLLQKTDFYNLKEDERQLLTNYNLLNYNGKIEARKRIEELSMISIYTISEPMLNAAHARTDIDSTDEDQAHDDAIMNDDSEWK